MKPWFSAALAVLFLSGCAAGTSYVRPTPVEESAARPHKKTLAILAVDEAGSPIRNVQITVADDLEYWLTGRYNLVSRKDIARFLTRAPANPSDQAVEAGSKLKADYALFVRVSVFPSMTTPPAVSPVPGQIVLPKPIIKAVLDLSVLDTRDGREALKDRIEGWDEIEIGNVDALLQSGATADPQRLLHVLSGMSDYRRSSDETAANAIHYAAEHASRLIYGQFPLEGTVLKLVSPTEVAVNLGSAYGVVPGDKMVLWKSGEALTDPRTGLIVNPLEAREIIEVTSVTGGLTCIAKGPKKTVSQARTGDKVLLQ